MPGLGLIGFVCKKKKFKTYLWKFQDRFNNLPLRRMEIVFVYLLVYKQSWLLWLYMQAWLHRQWAPLYRFILNQLTFFYLF